MRQSKVVSIWGKRKIQYDYKINKQLQRKVPEQINHITT